jgi:hypothetical protein
MALAAPRSAMSVPVSDAASAPPPPAPAPAAPPPEADIIVPEWQGPQPLEGVLTAPGGPAPKATLGVLLTAAFWSEQVGSNDDIFSATIQPPYSLLKIRRVVLVRTVAEDCGGL